jgi:hypothetical protein
MSSRLLARRMLAAYAESEPWKAEHDEVMRFYEVEEAIAYGNSLFLGLTTDDALWQAHVQRGELVFREEDRLQIAANYRSWIETSQRILSEVDRLAQDRSDIQGIATFRQHLQEAICILDAESFETELPPVEQLLLLADQGNPRPDRYGD